MLKLYNTLTHKKQVLRPLRKNRVGLYTRSKRRYKEFQQSFQGGKN